MAIFKCKMCGGTLKFEQDATVGICDSCGTKQTLPRLDDDRRANLYDRANHFRRNNEFDRAEAIYEQILNEDNTDAEAYWSLVLCRYGVEYVEDPATHRRIPTVNRTQLTSVFDDADYKYALQYADSCQKEIYEEEARAINEIQKGILAIVQKEEPFDVFICYKETDNNGRRTPDSVLANDLYHQLIQEGIRVFFARITLEDKLGTDYEPYIFAALNSAKVMVVLGTRPEHFNAVWVKNEWSRYLALVKKSGGKKVLIPAYRDMDSYDLPDEFSHLQAQDMSRLGFMQDLLRGIAKVLDAGRTILSPEPVKETVVVRSEGGVNLTALIKRGNMALEDGEFERADEFFEHALNIDAECPEAYAGKLCAKWWYHSLAEIKQAENPEVLRQDKNYQKAICYGSEILRTEMEGYVVEAERRQREKIVVAERRQRAKAEALLPIRKRLEPMSTLIIVALGYTVGLRTDGTVVAVGRNDEGQCDVGNWTDIVAVAAGRHTVGLRSDGTVVAVGYNKDGRCDVGSWRDIVAIAANRHTVGLRSDGTVVAVGDNKYGQCDVGSWTDIVAVAAGCWHTVGLKSDGTVVAVGRNDKGQCDVDSWTDIVAVAVKIECFCGMKSDGTDLACFESGGRRRNANEWIDFVEVESGYEDTVGLRSDGTVVVAGYNKDRYYDVESWTDIVAVETADYHIVGLRSDGTMVAVGRTMEGQCNVGGWRDIVAVTAGCWHTVGLKLDGTVVAVGYNYYKLYDVDGWRDIVAVATGYHTVGLKSDGTVVAVGNNKYGQCDVGGWKLFNSIDTLEEDRRKAVEEQKAKAEAERQRRETERRHREEERRKIIIELNTEKSNLHSELANLKGLFTGKRRREIETRLAEVETELNRHKRNKDY